MISRIKFTIGLFCGGNKSYKAIDYFIESILKIPLASIARYEYRGGPESQDSVITFRDGKTEIIPGEKTDKSWGILPRDRCNACWDFSAELADVSVGDIFLPRQLARLTKYTSLISRTLYGAPLIDGAAKTADSNPHPTP